MAALFGDWGRLGLWFRKVKFRATSSGFEDDFTQIGLWVKRRIEEHIDNQSLPWEPLKLSTRTRKGHGKVYLDSGEFRRSLDLQVKKTGTFSMEVSVMPRGDHKGSGMSMQQLASYMEYGTPGMAARPIWRPVLMELEQSGIIRKELSSLGVKFGFDSV